MTRIYSGRQDMELRQTAVAVTMPATVTVQPIQVVGYSARNHFGLTDAYYPRQDEPEIRVTRKSWSERWLDDLSHE